MSVSLHKILSGEDFVVLVFVELSEVQQIVSVYEIHVVLDDVFKAFYEHQLKELLCYDRVRLCRDCVQISVFVTEEVGFGEDYSIVYAFLYGIFK